MAKFKFRLQTLLRLREVARDERRAELAQAYRAEELLRRREGEVQTEVESLGRFCRQTLAPGSLDVDRLLAARRYELVLRTQLTQIARQQETVREEIERRRQTVVEATREVRVLEQLRERQQQRHRDEEARNEMKQLDEAAGRVLIAEEGR